MKNKTLSLILNSLIIIFVTFAFSMMFNGIKFVETDLALEDTGFGLFKYFTVDSNLLMFICSFIYVIYLFLLTSGKITKIPKWVTILKMVGTISVTITFMVTVFFLAPTFGHYAYTLFVNSNLYFHVLVPLLAILTLICFENEPLIKFKECLFGMIPLALYTIYYMSNVLSHYVDGKVDRIYDFYGFAQFGVVSIIVSLIFMYSFNLLLCYLFKVINHKMNK